MTSAQASPRGGVTYQQLVETADSSKSYQEGILAGMAVIEIALMVIGGLPIATLGIGSVALVAGLSSTKKRRVRQG